MTDIEVMFEELGRSRQNGITAEDGYYIRYSTGRVQGGKYDGKFLTIGYKPIGPGARSGNATRWTANYIRAFSTRKAAKARLFDLYYQHSPEASAKRAARESRVDA
jgi:hypothetical protein